MSKKLMLLAAGALSALAFAALPSIASAGSWECDDVTTGGACETFTGTNNTVTKLTQEGSTGTAGPTVECTANSVDGKYFMDSKTTGTMQITFTGCKSNGFACTTSGQKSETITTEALTFHNILLEPTAPKTPGVLITPNENGKFATFTCLGFISLDVEGNGIIGRLTRECTTKVAANAASTIDFESVATGTQKWKQVTTTGVAYDLLSKDTFTNATRTGSQDGEGSIKFADETQVTC